MVKEYLCWHVFPRPKNIKIQSFYEIAMILLLLCGCLYVYFKCNEVPYNVETIEVECLDNRNPNAKYTGVYIYPEANIWLRISHSTIVEIQKRGFYLPEDGGKVNNYVSAYFGENFFFLSPTDSVIQQSQKRKNDYFFINAFADDFAKTYEDTITFYRKLDSIKRTNNIKIQDPKSNYNWRSKSYRYKEQNKAYLAFLELAEKNKLANKARTPVFYLKSTQTIQRGIGGDVSLYNLSSKWQHDEKTSSFIKNYLDGNINTQEIFFYGHVDFRSVVSERDAISITPPSWYSLRDISQSYYYIKLNSETIDSLKLWVDFGGVTSFSKMYPEPDEITMSGICFKDSKKMSEIRNKGILFHVQFKELTNTQNVRMFFLTATMSALLCALILFLILALYKIFTLNSRIKEKRERLKRKDDNSEERNNNSEYKGHIETTNNIGCDDFQPEECDKN